MMEVVRNEILASLQMQLQVLVRCQRPSRKLSTFLQGDEICLGGMLCSHVLVLLVRLIGHLLAAVCAVDVPGAFDLEPEGAIWIEYWLRLLLAY